MTIEELYEIFSQHPTVTTDSRNCPKNSIFFALKGENFNGNTYAQASLNKGCAYAVVDEKEFVSNDHILLVDNVLATLQQLAHYHRIALGIPIVGITGTNGKTTTKELLSTVLKKKFNLYYTQGNLNNHIGVPLTLLSINKSHKMAVVEMGASHPGEIKTLVNIVAPNAGLITNVGKAHLEGFGSFEGVIKTKCELYDFLKDTDGQVFVNLDNPILTEKSESMNRTGYALENKNGLVWGKVTGNSPFLEMEWNTDNDTNTYTLKTHLIGTYNAENVMAAVCAGRFFGIDPNDICDAINSYAPQNNRSQMKDTKTNKLIIDAYNANPTSMTASINNFALATFDNKTLILGDMRELGADSETEHQKIIDLLNSKGLTDVYLVGDCFGKTKCSFKKFANVDKLIEQVKKEPIANHTILVKGSNGTHLVNVVEYL